VGTSKSCVSPHPCPISDAPQGKSKDTTLDDNIRAKPEKLCQPKVDLNDHQEIESSMKNLVQMINFLSLNEMIVSSHHPSLLMRILMVLLLKRQKTRRMKT
jgi:hypothetical protein